MATSADVLIVGSINVDLVVHVERLPAAGETVTGGVFARHPGGKGGNQAVAAARLGARVVFVGAVGSDDDGSSALEDLLSEGVDTARVARLEGVASGVALIVVDAAGENQIAVASGANARLDEQLVAAALADVSVGGDAVYLANLEVSDEALLAGARFAAAKGMRIVLNPAPARPLADELLALHPILLPNAGEAALLSGEAEPARAARRLAHSTGEAVLITLGAEGALLYRDGELTVLPALAVEAVDTTGAGDTLAGAFAAELAAGKAIVPAVRFALAAAAHSVTRPGARGGMPRRGEVEALLR
jgi:ribokinase